MGTYTSKYTGQQIDENIEKISNLVVPTNLSELNNDVGYITDFTETDPTVPDVVKTITETDVDNWNNKAEKSDMPKLITLTQTEYDALVSAGTVDNNTYYFIKEE